MPRVIVIGGANVDIKGRAGGRFVSGSSNPGAVTLSPGGVGRNIAENLARLGVEVSLVTALGRDANGQLLRDSCSAAGVSLSHAISVEEPTGTYLAILDEAGELVSAVSDMRAIDALSPTHLEAISVSLADTDMLIADCNLSTGCLDWLCGFTATQGLRLLIEPVSVAKALKLHDVRRPAPVYAVTPNAQQLAALAGGDISALHGLGFANVVLHLGGAGAIASDGTTSVRIAAEPAAAILDVTGAGDAAVAGLACGLLEGLSLAEAARLGQRAAAVKLASAQSVASGLSRDSLRRF